MPERTITELTVLAMLGHLRGEASGYDLKRFADESLGYLWAPSKTQLYVTLRRLVADRLVVARDVRQAGRPDKQLYRLTTAGRRVVREWLEDDDNGDEPDKSLFMLKFFFGRQASPAAMARQLAAFRRAYAARLETYQETAHGDGHPTRDAHTFLALRYGIERAKAAVRWADIAARELRTVGTAPR